MVSVFNTLGKIITKHPLAVIAIWVIMLLAASQYVGVFNNNLQYDMQKFLPKDMGAVLASDKYSEQFPGNDNSSILVVVQSENKTQSMRFIDALNGSLKNDPAVRNMTNTTSVYSVQRSILVNMTPDMYRGLDNGFDNVSKGNRELYNHTDDLRNKSDKLYYLRDNVTSINSNLNKGKTKIRSSLGQMYGLRDRVVSANGALYKINDIADLVYGIPAAYAGGFQSAKQSGQDNNNSSTAGMQAAQSVVNGIQDTQSKQMAQGWLNTFNGQWRQQLQSNPGLANDPMGLAQSVINQAGRGFFDGLGLPAQQQSMVDGVLTFGMGGWTNKTALESNVVGLAMKAQNVTGDTQKSFFMAAYGLGKNPSAYAIDNLVIGMVSSTSGMSRGDVESVYGLGRNPSDGAIGSYLVDKAISSIRDSDNGRNMTPSDLQNATDVVHDAWNLGPAATDQDFDNYVLQKAGKDMSDSDKKNMTIVYGWGPHPNDSVIRDFVLSQAGIGHNATENQTYREIYDLGENASNDTIEQYVARQAMKDKNITSNASYFLALMELPRNMSDDDVKAFAGSWVMTHSYDDPKILPDSVVKKLASGNLALLIVATSDSASSTSAHDNVVNIRQHITDILKDPEYSGVKTYVTGEAAFNVDTAEVKSHDSATMWTIILLLVILCLYFRSVLTPLAPLAIVGIAAISGMGLMGILSNWINFFNVVSTLMIAIILGAGTDYCVFMLSRYSEERSHGAGVKESVVAAVTHAGRSIASSGTAAMIGFGALIIVDQGVLMSIGIAGAVSILFCLLVAITLMPAVMTIVGDRIFWPHKVYNAKPGMTSGLWRGITSRVLKHSKLVIVLAILVAIPAVYVVSQMQLGDDTVAMQPDGTESKIGYYIMDDTFGSGDMGQAMVVATMPSGLRDASGNYTPGTMDQVESLSAMLAAIPGVDKVYSVTRPEGATISYTNLSAYVGAEKEYYQSYMDNNTGQDGRTTLISVSFVGSPYSEQAGRTIDTIKEKMDAYEKEHAGTTLLLGGGPVGPYEYESMAMGKYPLVIGIVFVGLFLILVFMLQSVFTPLRLMFTLSMSVSWTLALFVLEFQYGLQTSLSWIIPIILFCMLMGMGVDYDIFLVSRIREEVLKGKSDEEAIKSAIEATGTIITLCGAVMAAAFGAMMLASTMIQKEMGFVLCLGVILDATLMRMVVVPSIMVLMKKYNWWMPFVKSEVAKARERTAAEAVPEATGPNQ